MFESPRRLFGLQELGCCKGQRVPRVLCIEVQKVVEWGVVWGKRRCIVDREQHFRPVSVLVVPSKEVL